MSAHSEVFMSNGTSYQLTATAEEIYQIITHSDGRPLNHIHSFETSNEESVFLNTAHIVSIVPYRSYADIDEEKRDESNNVKAAKKFKDELGDNME